MLLLIFFALSGCSAHKYNQLKISGDGKDCFNKRDIITLIKHNYVPNDKSEKFLIIGKNVTDSTGCVGLYNYVFTGLSSNRVIRKVLKFEDKIYDFSDKKKNSNELALKEFINLYKDKFTKEKMDELIAYANAVDIGPTVAWVQQFFL